MHLDAEWKWILRHAWSIRLIVLAGLLSGAEAVLPRFDGLLPDRLFSALTFFVVAAALVARLVVQRRMSK